MKKVIAAFYEAGRPLEPFEAYLYDDHILADLLGDTITFYIFATPIAVVNGKVHADTAAANYRMVEMQLNDTATFYPSALDGMSALDFIKQLKN